MTPDQDDYIENKKQDFFEGDANKREAIIEELRNEGLIDEVEYLENWQREEDLQHGADYSKEEIERADDEARDNLYFNSLNK